MNLILNVSTPLIDTNEIYLDSIPLIYYDSLIHSEYLELDWFTEEHAKCIVKLYQLKDESQNLDKFKRLMFDHVEDPEIVLSKMTSLEWLNISYNFDGLHNPFYWTSVKQAVNNHLHELQYLDFKNLNIFKKSKGNSEIMDYRSLTATSTAKINRVLDSLINIGNEHLTQIDLKLKLENITDSIRQKYGIDMLYAYEVTEFNDERFKVKNRLFNKPIEVGDVLLSRQSSAFDYIFDLYNLKYLGESENIEIMRLGDDGVVRQSFVGFIDN